MLRDERKKSAQIVLRGEPVTLVWSQWEGTGDPQPWIFLHGMGSSRFAYVDLLAAHPLPGRYWALDLPGFGDSGLPRFVQTLGDFREALKQFIALTGLEKPILVGHSFGGMVAGDFAAAYPAMIGGLILVSSAGYFPPSNAMEPTPWVFINRIGLWVTSLDYWGNQMLRALGLDPHAVPALSRRRMRYGWRRAKEMARMGKFYDTPGFVPKIQAAHVPTAAVHGDRDILFPLPKVLQSVSGAFPVLVESGAGHLPYDYDLPRFTYLLRQAADHVMRESGLP